MHTLPSRAPLMAYLNLVMAQVSVGLNVVFAKYLIERMPPLAYIEYRFLYTAIIMGIVYYGARQSMFQPALPKTTKPLLRDWLTLFALAMTGGLLFNLIMTWGLDYTNASSAGVVCATLPAVAVFLSVMILKEKFTRTLGISALLAVIGIVFLNHHQTAHEMSPNPLFGNLLVLLAMLPEALYFVFNKLCSKRLSPTAIAFFCSTFTTIVMYPIMRASNCDLDAIVWTADLHWIMAASVLSCVLFFWCWARGAVHVSASTSAIFTGIMPIAAVGAGVCWLGEMFGPWQWVGTCFVLVSIWVGSRSQH